LPVAAFPFSRVQAAFASKRISDSIRADFVRADCMALLNTPTTKHAKRPRSAGKQQSRAWLRHGDGIGNEIAKSAALSANRETYTAATRINVLTT
jgi:hypothetical protein